MKSIMNWKQNNLQKAYSNMLSSVRPYSADQIIIAAIATDCDFTGRLGHLEPDIGRLRC